MKDILGKSISNYFEGDRKSKLWINNTHSDPDEMPLDYYFRDKLNMPELEHFAMEHCRGKILDIGAAAGAHSLILQDLKQDVTALDISPLLAKILKVRGINQVIEGNIFNLDSSIKYDTLLLLMNGIGISQSISGLDLLLQKLKSLMAKNGQVLFDSSDVSYFYNEELPQDKYHGEITYQYEYKGEKGDWFSWLYVDFETLRKVAIKQSFKAELLAQDEDEHFLCRLTLT
jgi:hypothetical protein